MSSFEKLSIQGIRSFGPNDKDKKMITFFHPLTLILGDNGCGKTTIIEALKFAAAGELPANTKTTCAFIHDPKLTCSSEVRGQVKLQIRDLKNEVLAVQRTIQATQKIKKLEYKSIDQVISRKNEVGEWSSISGRCADIDSEMCYALGVSKAILCSVLLCHQEDSNWPLDEPKQVKERFDAIFGAEKYNKCLEQIRKLRKAYDQEQKVLEVDFRHLKQYKTEASQKRSRLAEIEDRMSQCQQKIENFLSKLRPIEESLKEIASKEDHIGQLHTDCETKKTKLESVKNSIKDYRKAIQHEFKGSEDDLMDAINNFQSELKNKLEELELVEKQGEKVVIEIKRNQQFISEEQLKIGQLTRDLEKNKERIESRNSAIMSLTEDLQISTSVSQLNQPDQIQKVLTSLNEAVSEKENELSQFKGQQQAEVAKMQKEIDNHREERARVEQNVQNKKLHLQQNKKELDKIKADIDEVDQSAERLVALQNKLDRVKRELDDVIKNNDMNALENEIKSVDQQREKQEDDLAILESEIQNLQLTSTIQAELDIHRSTKATKDAEINKLKKRHIESIKHLLKTVPEQGIKLQLEACLDKLADDVKVKTEEIKKKENEISTIEAERKHLLESLRSAKHGLDADEFAIKQACDGNDYDSYVEELGNKVQELQDKKGTLSSSEHMFRRYVQKLQQEDPCCPLCHREFNETDEVTSLISELTIKVKEVPSKLRTNKMELDSSQEKYKTLLQLKPRYERLATLKMTEIPNIEAKLENAEKKLNSTKEILTSLKLSLEVPQSDEALAKSIHSDVVLLEQHITESRRLQREINRLEAKLTPGTKRTLQEALQEQKELRASLQIAKRLYDSLITKRTNIISKKQQLQEQKNSLQEQQMKITGNAQMRTQLAERREELENVEVMLQMEIEKGTEELSTVSRQVDHGSRQMKSLITSHGVALDAKTHQLRKIQQRLDELKKLHSSVLEYEASGGSKKLETAQNNLHKFGKNSDTLHQKRDSIYGKRDNLKSYISSQKSRERELDDNLKLRQKLKEEKELIKLVEKLKTQIGNFDFSTLHEKKKQLKQEEEKLFSEKGQAEGSKRELEQNIATIKSDLKSDVYKNADINYRNKMIELEVTKQTREDLNTYYKALDAALLNYHKKRMEQINKTIRDLWRKIYSGNDIDTIEIKTEQEDAVSVDKKRAYKYRVVQVKTGTELDMRGRCSAGQKVLASLIIRIALAETFCANCGILALDEPTTNLDHQNILRLSCALEEIVRIQSSRKNFQLIIITHDQEFLSNLIRMAEIETYYKMERNDEGLSQILKITDHNY